MAGVAHRYRAGETQSGIAASLGVSQRAVRSVLDHAGEPLHTSCPVSGVHRQTILNCYEEGESIREISGSLGLNFATVYQVLRRAGRVEKKHS